MRGHLGGLAARGGRGGGVAPAWRDPGQARPWGGGGRGTGSSPHGRLPSGSEAAWLNVCGDPLPPGPGHRKLRAATWWAGAGTPQRGDSRSSRAPQGAWNCEEWEKPEARILITPDSLLRAYVSTPAAYRPLGLSLPNLM